MKLGGIAVGGLALCIAIALATEENDYHHAVGEAAEAQKLANINDQLQTAETKRFADAAEPETRAEDQEIEASRRVRTRSGVVKRRRRLRKRLRTTTEEPSSEDLYDGQNYEPQYSRARRIHQQDQIGEEYQAVQRRRPGKRRRRPARRYQDHHLRTDYPEERPRQEDELEIPRRRRKGGRKRQRIGDVKPPPSLQIDEEPFVREHDFNRRPVHQETTTQEVPTSTNLPEIDYGSKRINEGSPVASEPPYQPEDSDRPTSESYTESEEVVTTTEHYAKQESEDDNLSDFEFHAEDIDDRDNSTSLNAIGTEQSPVAFTEETTSTKPETTREEIVFDRKSLFPTSKRLPPTSALIRRRLRPKSKPDIGDEDTKDLTRNEIVPGALLAQGNYTEISAEQLLEQWRSHMESYNAEPTTEEPNYPKLLPRVEKTAEANDNKSTEAETKQNEPRTDISENSGTDSAETSKAEKNKSQNDVKPDETLKYEALDIPNVKDDILELLKSETGATRLARILELRNMTLVDLIQHRERGSSQLHLSEIFKRSHHTDSDKGEAREEAEGGDGSAYAKPENGSAPIEFPNEEILGSFPKFLLEQIEGGDNATEKAEGSQVARQNETRESRAFKTGGTSAIPKRVPPYPTWKVIPNPRLKPVSVQGEYEEIYLSKFLNRQNSSEETNEVIAFGETDGPVFHKNNVRGQLSAESIRTKVPSQTTFRRIAPGMKSAIIVSGAILVLAIFGFLSVLISCRIRQRRARLRAKQDILCEQLQSEEFMNSQRSLSPVLTKAHREPVFTQGIHSNTTSNRHYYLWRTLRKTFQYD